MTGAQAFQRLCQLRDKTGEAHYERVKLAVTCIEDRRWVESECGGSVAAAYDKLAEEVLADICCGKLIPPEMLTQIYRKYRTLEEWKRFKFDFAKMADTIAKEGRKPSQRSSVPSSIRKLGVLLTPDEVALLSPARVLREYSRVYRTLMATEAQLERQSRQNSA